MDISVKDAQYFLAVAAEGNLTHAAQKLYISQPALSFTVKKIEQQLNIKLFVRENNRLKLTYEGQRFAEACNNIVKICRDMENEFSDMKYANSGKVVVGMPFNLICYAFPLLYKNVKARYPEIHLTPVEGNTQELEALLFSGEIDVAFIPYFIKNPEQFNILQVFHEKLVLSVPEDHEMNRYAEKRPGYARPFLDFKLADHEPFVLNAPRQHVRFAAEQAFRNAGISPKTVFVTKNVTTSITTSAVGLGLALFPEHYLSFSKPPSGANYYYIDEEYDPGWRACVIYRKNTYFSDACRQCVEVLTKIFSDFVPSTDLEASTKKMGN